MLAATVLTCYIHMLNVVMHKLCNGLTSDVRDL